MTIQSKLMANGAFDVSFKPDTPRDVLLGMSWLSTVVFTDPQIDPDLTDPMDVGLWSGVLYGVSARRIRGYGLAKWLGDDDLGQPYESTIEFGGVAPSALFPTLLPDPIQPGTIHDSGDVFVGHVGKYQLPKAAIGYVCTTMGLEWRVNPDATMDVGSESQLFTDPQRLLYPPFVPGRAYPRAVVPAAIIVNEAAADVDLETLTAASLEHEADVEDYANAVIVVGEGLAAVTAEVASTLVDPHGNPVRLVKVISEPDMDAGNLAARAVAEVEHLAQTRNEVSLSVDDYRMASPDGGVPAVDVGATVWVYDPPQGLFDTANPIQWGGSTVYPVALRVLGVTRPVTEAMGVYVGSPGSWTDLSDYVEPESGSVTLEVGASKRQLVSLSRQREAFRTRVNLS